MRTLALLFTLVSFISIGQKLDTTKLFDLERLSKQTVNSSYHEGAPMISPDGETLYFFVTNHPENRAGKDGSQDVWFSLKKEDGSWTKAARMSNTINREKSNQVMAVVNNGNTPNINSNGQFGNFFFNRVGAGVVNSIPSLVNPIQGNSLRFVSSGSSLHFDTQFLGDESLSVINGIFVGNREVEEEVADTGGNVEQIVKDQNIYDKFQLGNKAFELLTYKDNKINWKIEEFID